MRPDFSQLARQQRTIATFVGETATHRRYRGVSAGQPQFGIGDEPIYASRTVTGLFRPSTFEEIQQAGGQIVQGDIMATLLDCQPDKRDEVVWRGTIYRVESEFIPERIVGGAGYRGLLRRGDATG